MNLGAYIACGFACKVPTGHGSWKSECWEHGGRFKCGWRSWLCYTMAIPWDWHCVSCNCPMSVSLVSVSTGDDISSQGQGEERYLQTNHSSVSQTLSAGHSAMSHTPLTPNVEEKKKKRKKELGWSQFKTAGLHICTNTHAHTERVREAERPWPDQSPQKLQCQSSGSK